MNTWILSSLMTASASLIVLLDVPNMMQKIKRHWLNDYKLSYDQETKQGQSDQPKALPSFLNVSSLKLQGLRGDLDPVKGLKEVATQASGAVQKAASCFSSKLLEASRNTRRLVNPILSYVFPYYSAKNQTQEGGGGGVKPNSLSTCIQRVVEVLHAMEQESHPCDQDLMGEECRQWIRSSKAPFPLALYAQMTQQDDVIRRLHRQLTFVFKVLLLCVAMLFILILLIKPGH